MTSRFPGGWRLLGLMGLTFGAMLMLHPGVHSGEKLPLHKIRLPKGFSIELYATGVPDARSLALSPSGVLYVGSRGKGNVYAVVDTDGDHHADRVYVIASGLMMPNGVAYRNGSLYVAEVHRILRFDDIDRHLDDPPKPVVIRDDLPRERWHGWKYIRFGPDGWLYVPIGAPCNVCEREDPRFATISRMKPDGSKFEIFARGVRNSVGFDWDPATGDLWFTDNGRDWLGDDLPPDELNHAPRPGLHFGFPYCHGGDIPDPEFGSKRDCKAFVPPAIKLGPHVASLGMEFYRGKMFPAKYRGNIFIAEHGSWNRSVPIGYRVTWVEIKNGRAVAYRVFAEGWLQGREPWGRPVDLEMMPDGSLLVSDDFAGVIYRITYRSGKGHDE